jgi:NAD(P)-dependent dehydrogenase (short-subunit alcohol dehydrogenase family)
MSFCKGAAMPTIAIFGAGPGLGLSVASRFIKEGYDVALVARDPVKLERLVAAVDNGGGTIGAFVAELTERAQVRAAADAIIRRFGVPDVVLYAPADVSHLPVSAVQLDADELERWIPLRLLSPVALVHAVLPGMVRRGSGALLFALGAGARERTAELASSNIPQAGLLNYVHSLATETTPQGVYCHALLISALIDRSAAQELFDSGHFADVHSGPIPRIDPDELAERCWKMIAQHGPVEADAP